MRKKGRKTRNMNGWSRKSKGRNTSQVNGANWVSPVPHSLPLLCFSPLFLHAPPLQTQMPCFLAFPVSFLSVPSCSPYFPLLVPCFLPSFFLIIKRTRAPVPSLTSIPSFTSIELSTSRDYLINRPLVHRHFSISNAGVKRYIFLNLFCYTRVSISSFYTIAC